MANESLVSIWFYSCTLCTKSLPITEFRRDSSRSNGYSNKCRSCWEARYRTGNKEGNRYVVTEFQGLTGHWTKWGGGVKGEVVYTQIGLIGAETEWACQSCGQLQPIDLSPYLAKHPDSEVQSERIRVCAICFNNDCLELKKRRGEV